MDSFVDQNFGHILRDLGSTNEVKEHFNSPAPLREAVYDNLDVPDNKIFTPLEIPKSKSQLHFCKSLTEKVKSDDVSEFPLTQIKSCEVVKNVYSETPNDRYLLTNPTVISNEVPRVSQNPPIFEDRARQEILACLSDIPLPPLTPDNHINNSNSEVVAPVLVEKTDKSLDLPPEETTVTQPVFFQQKLKSSNAANSTKRKAADTSICPRPAKQTSKAEPCLYYPGMIVWAKITGYSYWPAMIDNDPDANAYSWPNDSASAFTHYHVVFFDTNGRLSRSWVKVHYLKLFTEVVKISNSRPKDYIERFKRSVKEAKEAMNLSIEDRLKKYSFKERLKLPGTVLCQD